MIKNIIFDFGDIFINLDKQAPIKAFTELGLTFRPEIESINNKYEVGAISSQEFIASYKEWLPNCSEQQIIDAWNSILLDFPEFRLNFLKELASNTNYKLFLLSNTNDLHIDWIKSHVSFYEDFKNQFDVFYLSQEIGYRKPNNDIYEFVLHENKIVAHETLFIDDTTPNTITANQLGIHTWNLQPGKEDVIDLFKIKADLF